MAKVLPAGSTSTRGFPPTLSGSTTIVSGTSWIERVNIDFTSESTWSPTADGQTQTFQGTQWTIKDDVGTCVGAGDMGVDSSGMFITPPDNYGDWWNSTFNAPRFFAELTNGTNPLYPNGGFGQQFALQAIVESPNDIAANYDAFGIIIVDGGTAPASGFSIQNGRIYVNGDYQRIAMQAGGVQYDTYLSAGTPHTFYEAVFFGSNIYFASGPYTDFAEPMTRTDFRAQYNPNNVRGETPANWNIDVDNLMFMLYTFTVGNTSTSINPRMSKFRLLSIGEEGAIQT